MRLDPGLSVALIVLLVAFPLAAQTNQGQWSGTARPDSPACGADLALAAQMTGDVMRGQITFLPGAPMFDWSVTRDGSVFGGGMTGRINAGRLSGTWQRLEKGRMCLYRVEMLKR